MKKTVNINLGGYPFTINEDAYAKMEEYFSSLEKHFTDFENPHEIIFDIEVRMAELFKENAGTHAILSLSDINEAISILGTPEDFAKEDIDLEEERVHIKKKTTQNKSKKNYRVGKKLFRDPENKIIGGVCSGLAKYLGIEDPIWVRLFFILLLFSGTSPIFYIIMLIAIPKAKTEVDKKEMRGEPIDIDTIARSIEDEFNNLSGQIKDFTDSFRNKKK